MTPLYTRPGAIMLLDVDGVVNVENPGWHPPHQEADVLYGDQEFQLRWSPQLIARLQVLIATGLVDVHWCSTWNPYADRLESLWGLPTLTRCPELETLHDTPRQRTEAKRAAARRVIEEGHRLIWIDDDAHPVVPERRFFTKSGRALLIQTSGKNGLTSRQLDTVTAFATAGVR